MSGWHSTSSRSGWARFNNQTQPSFGPGCCSQRTQTHLRTLLGHLSEGRRIVLLSWLDETAGPDRHAILSALLDGAASPPGVGSMLRETLRRFHSRVELGRIVSEARISRLLAICSEEEAV